MAAVRAARLLHFASQPPKGFKCFTLIQALTSECSNIQNNSILLARYPRISNVFFIVNDYRCAGCHLLNVLLILAPSHAALLNYNRRLRLHLPILIGAALHDSTFKASLAAGE
jgi:hypothetical protein